MKSAGSTASRAKRPEGARVGRPTIPSGRARLELIGRSHNYSAHLLRSSAQMHSPGNGDVDMDEAASYPIQSNPIHFCCCCCFVAAPKLAVGRFVCVRRFRVWAP